MNDDPTIATFTLSELASCYSGDENWVDPYYEIYFSHGYYRVRSGAPHRLVLGMRDITLGGVVHQLSDYLLKRWLFWAPAYQRVALAELRSRPVEDS